MKKEVKLNPHMGEQILDHLRQFADLPTKGIIAGQSVDSAITDLFGNGGGVYNDVDVFRTVRNDSRIARSDRKAEIGTLNVGSLVPKLSEYRGMGYVMKLVQRYQIAAVARKGLLNTVYTLPFGTARELSPWEILASFDLNCVRVAVDLQSKKLYWDKHYQEFLHSRQLKIAMMHTPWHTFGRLSKKRQELPDVYADMELAALACVGVTGSSEFDDFCRFGLMSVRCGTKYHEMLEGQKAAWEPFMRMEGKVIQDRTRRADDGTCPETTIFTCKAISQVPEDLMESIQNMKLAALFNAYTAAEAFKNKKSSKVNLNAELVMNHNTALKEKGLQGWTSSNLEWFGPAYLKGHISPGIYDKVDRFLSAHVGLRHGFMGKSLGEQFTLMNHIKELSKEFGEKYYMGSEEACIGLLEGDTGEPVFDNRESLTRYLEEAVVRDLEPFKIVPLNLPSWVSRPGLLVEELLTRSDLATEGGMLKHCVGGYGPRIRQGGTRILRIRTGSDLKKDWSTVELTEPWEFQVRRKKNPTLPAVWKVVQHRRYKNEEPTAYNKEVLTYVMAHLELQSHQLTFGSGQIVLTKTRLQRFALTKMRLAASRLRSALMQLNDRLDKAARKLGTKENQLEMSEKTLSKSLSYASKVLPTRENFESVNPPASLPEIDPDISFATDF